MPEDDRPASEGTFDAWLQWAMDRLGRDPARAAVAARAAADMAAGGGTFDACAGAARSAWNAAGPQPHRASPAAGDAAAEGGPLWWRLALVAGALYAVFVLASQAAALSSVEGYAWPCSDTVPLNQTVCVTDSATGMQYAFGFISLPEYSVAGMDIPTGAIAKGDRVTIWLSGGSAVAITVNVWTYSTPKYRLLTSLAAGLAPIVPVASFGLLASTLLMAAAAVLYALGSAPVRPVVAFAGGVATELAVAVAPPWSNELGLASFATAVVLGLGGFFVSVLFGIRGMRAGSSHRFHGGAIAGIALAVGWLVVVASVFV